MPPERLEALYGPFKRIGKWTPGPFGPDFAFQVTTITISVTTDAPVESVAETCTV